MELLQIYFKNLKKLAIFTGTNFLAFFCFYLKKNISRIRTLNADPDLGEKMNADPCGSGSTALLKAKEKGVKNLVDTVPLGQKVRLRR